MEQEVINEIVENSFNSNIKKTVVKEWTELPDIPNGHLAMMIPIKKRIIRINFNLKKFLENFTVGAVSYGFVEGNGDSKKIFLSGAVGALMTLIPIKIGNEVDYYVIMSFAFNDNQNENEVIERLKSSFEFNEKSIESSINNLIDKDIIKVISEDEEDRVLEVSEVILEFNKEEKF